MKNSIVIFLMTVLLGAFSFTVSQVLPDSAQLAAFNNLTVKMNNKVGVNWDAKTGTPDIITLEKPHSYAAEPTTSAKLFLKEIKNLLKKKDVEDDLILQQINQVDSIQYLRFSQSYKNIPVRGGEYVITVLPGGKVQSALGKFHKNISIDVTPKLSLIEVFSSAKQNSPKDVKLKDSLSSSQLIIYPKDSVNVLAWELVVPGSQEGEDWIYIIDASNGEVVSRLSTMINETFSIMRPTSQANVYLHHPFIDASYINVSPINDNSSGYLQGTYTDVFNDAASRAYNSSFNFAYSTSDTHFDEANLFYHIDNFRRNFWDGIGFNAFTQIMAHAHTYFSGGPNASYSLSDHNLRFSDGQGVTGYNSFAREDKVIYHEYTHAVTDYVAHLYNTAYNGYNETYAISEGNSDYFAGSFTNRALHGEYSSSGHAINQRNMDNPRIANYTQYNDQSLSYWQIYGYHEPHFGGELWSAALWDLRKTGTGIGAYYADRVAYQGLNAIPTNSSFLQYRQAIINADINNYSGTHANTIRHLFYLRGIGPDYLSFSINGASELQFKQQGTYTAAITGGSGSVSYVWYKFISQQWSQISTNSSITLGMVYDDILIKLDIHDNVTGENVSHTMTIYYFDGLPKTVAMGSNSPSEFKVNQNYPNPFNPSTAINYEIPSKSFVTLKVYDVLGNEVAELVNEWKETGSYTAQFSTNGKQLASGMYFYTLSAGKFTDTKKFILLK